MTTLRSQITTILTTGIQGTPDGYFIHGAIDDIVALVEEEAVGFLEWKEEKGYIRFAYGWAPVLGGKTLSTQKLYQKYKEENK